MLSSLINFVFGVSDDENKVINDNNKHNNHSKTNKRKNNKTNKIKNKLKSKDLKSTTSPIKSQSIPSSRPAEPVNGLDSDSISEIDNEENIDNFEEESNNELNEETLIDPLSVVLSEVLRLDPSLDEADVRVCINEMWEFNLPYDDAKAVVERLKNKVIKNDNRNEDVNVKANDVKSHREGSSTSTVNKSKQNKEKVNEVHNNSTSLTNRLEQAASVSNVNEAFDYLIVWSSSGNQMNIQLLFESKALDLLLTSLLSQSLEEFEALVPRVISLLERLSIDIPIDSFVDNLRLIANELVGKDEQIVSLLGCRIAESLRKVRSRSQLSVDSSIESKDIKVDPLIQDLMLRERLSDQLLGSQNKDSKSNVPLFEDSEYHQLADYLSSLTNGQLDNKIHSQLAELIDEREKLVSQLQSIDQKIWSLQSLNRHVGSDSLSLIVNHLRSLETSLVDNLAASSTSSTSRLEDGDRFRLLDDYLQAELRCVQTICLRVSVSRDRVKHINEQMKVFGSMNMKVNLNECQQSVLRLEGEINEDEGTVSLMHRDTLSLLSYYEWNDRELVVISSYCNQTSGLLDATNVHPSDSWRNITSRYNNNKEKINSFDISTLVKPLSSTTIASTTSSLVTPTKTKNKKNNKKTKQDSNINAMDIIVNGSVRKKSNN